MSGLFFKNRLINPTDINQIRQAILKFLNNPDLANTMGKNGQKAVIEKFNWSSQEKKLLNLYNKISFN